MTEAHMHTVPSSTSVIEDTRDVLRQAKYFYKRNHLAIDVALVLGVSIYINRRILRRELKHITFAVELYGEYDGESDIADFFGVD